MSTQDQTPETVAGRVPVALEYRASSRLHEDAEGARLRLFTSLTRDPVRASAVPKDPIALREALSALHAIVSADFSYKPKDRSAYMAYQRMRKQSANLSAWAAQRAYFDWLSRNDPAAWVILDPVVTVHPDALIFEVFSKDEGAYAQLSVNWAGLEAEGAVECGTTHIDFSQQLFDGVQQMRSYRKTRIDIGPDAVGVQTDDETPVLEKTVRLPESWLRGFLQVQSASSLATASFSLAPMDLYNALRHLRLNADKPKGKRVKGGRGLRIELVPGEVPRIVLEPWETVMETTGGAYTGRKSQVVRVWGRRRLMLARRFLPFVHTIDVHLLGSGLPSFWVLRGEHISLTLGLTGFNSSNWSQALGFDVMLPRGEATEQMAQVVEALTASWRGTAKAVAKAAGLKPAEALAALQLACQHGLVMHDIAADVYRLRPLTAEPLDPEALRYRSPQEREAADLLATAKAVRITQRNAVHGVGLELTGKVTVAAEKREYRPQLLIADEGRVRKADCTCSFFRKHQLKEGPCAHLVALRRLEAEQAKARSARKGRSNISVETRSFARRHPRGEAVIQVALNKKRLKIRWGERSDTRLRLQTLVFDTLADARKAYFDRIDELNAAGYLDQAAG